LKSIVTQKNLIADEYHHIFECTHLSEKRKLLCYTFFFLRAIHKPDTHFRPVLKVVCIFDYPITTSWGVKPHNTDTRDMTHLCISGRFIKYFGRSNLRFSLKWVHSNMWWYSLYFNLIESLKVFRTHREI
jgi:hypothetical protein